MPQVQIKSPLQNESDLQDLIRSHPAFSDPRVLLNVATVTLVPERHAGRTMLFDRAAGVTVTLPAARGTGDRYRFRVKTTATSNSLIVKVGNTVDIIQGILVGMSDDPATAKGWEAGASDDTVTWNRTTTGTAKKGHWMELEDVAAGEWQISGQFAQSGTEATPFSAGV